MIRITHIRLCNHMQKLKAWKNIASWLCSEQLEAYFMSIMLHVKIGLMHTEDLGGAGVC